jgi:hypothetical protein
VEGSWSLTNCAAYPPSYTAIHDAVNLKSIHELHEFLNSPIWFTCVQCYKAWYSIDRGFIFGKLGATDACWFSTPDSEILRRWCFDASTEQSAALHRFQEVLELNQHFIECFCGAIGLQAGYQSRCLNCGCSSFRRQISVCHDCAVEPSISKSIRRRDYVVDPIYYWHTVGSTSVYETYMEHEDTPVSIPSTSIRVLGLTLSQFAPCIAALNDLEEMVLSLIHPLVQVYSIPRTGELAYVGHICNFRQDVKQFMNSLPVRPCDMPFVLIKPRANRNQDVWLVCA